MKRPESLDLPYPWYLNLAEWKEITEYVDHLTNDTRYNRICNDCARHTKGKEEE